MTDNRTHLAWSPTGRGDWVEPRCGQSGGDLAPHWSDCEACLLLATEDNERDLRDEYDRLENGNCPMCRPFPCDNPDQHLGVDPKYTPLRNRGCTCGADFDGRDCMCFEQPW